METNRYKIAIIGSGPAGLSAAARAAELGLSHLLLEAAGDISNTVNFWYQKGKHVMDEPAVLPLRSSIGFSEGSREEILDVWRESVTQLGINIRYNTALEGISGIKGQFKLKISGSDTEFEAEHVILAIGTMGNIRKLGIPGEDTPIVNYKLDNAADINNEHIVIVGAGDSAIEDAVALANNKTNKVTVINRRDGFDRAKSRNEAAINRAIQNKSINCFYNAKPFEIKDFTDTGKKQATLNLDTQTGSEDIVCNRIIIRAGAMPQRGMIDKMEISFPSKDETAFPIIKDNYESSREGIYIVGALAGCPLIKEAMNQGYEVIEFIEGRSIEPADQPLVEKVLNQYAGFESVEQTLAEIRAQVPYLREVSSLVLREYIRESHIRFYKKGHILYKPGDYASVISTIIEGGTALTLSKELGEDPFIWNSGEILGITSILQGGAIPYYLIAAQDTYCIDTPSRTATKLFNSLPSIKLYIQKLWTRRTIFQAFVKLAGADITPDIGRKLLTNTLFDEMLEAAEIIELKDDQVLFNEDDKSDYFFIIRKGTMSLSRKGLSLEGTDGVASKNPEVNLYHKSINDFIGLYQVVLDGKYRVTAAAATYTQLIKVPNHFFLEISEAFPIFRQSVLNEIRTSLINTTALFKHTETENSTIRFLEDSRVVEGTNVLLIDESLCVRCDNCEKACAETHNGIARMIRKAGETFNTVHIPTACRHCADPGCMKDCPPDAIKRGNNGNVNINADTCIGCGNCVANCPFGVVELAQLPKYEKPSLLTWLLTGKGRAPGTPLEYGHDPHIKKAAIKCDLCVGQSSGPACVQACPTGAASRQHPARIIELINKSTHTDTHLQKQR